MDDGKQDGAQMVSFCCWHYSLDNLDDQVLTNEGCPTILGGLAGLTTDVHLQTSTALGIQQMKWSAKLQLACERLSIIKEYRCVSTHLRAVCN